MGPTASDVATPKTNRPVVAALDVNDLPVGHVHENPFGVGSSSKLRLTQAQRGMLSPP